MGNDLRLRSARTEREAGFTLIELLIVILVIGILAAIAVPTFIRQQQMGQDADAISRLRNLMTHVEICFGETGDYGVCKTAAQLGLPASDVGYGTGQAWSDPGPEYSGGRFLLGVQSTSGDQFYMGRYFAYQTPVRFCYTPSGTPRGACRASGFGGW